jgi:flagellar biosynthesis protein FlhA
MQRGPVTRTPSGGALFSAAVVGVVALMIVPLPGAVLDVLLSMNIAFGVLLLLATILTARALDLGSFPSLLLIATLFRLALNVSTTRLILTTGEAGGVIRSFGQFVVGGSVVVGLVVFLILVVIQFVVITNGAARVAEVGARFTLDAMPGKQMAIDADLAAGLLDEDQARDRRAEVAREADFYGAMDGASKFVKGDAIAGILITLINLVGGMVVGVVQQGMPVGDAVSRFSLLTVGDGLVSQIPALMISIASGIIVTRATGDTDLGSDVARQLSKQDRALRYGGLAMLAMGVSPGLPFLPFAIVGTVMVVAGRRLAAAVPQVASEEQVEVLPAEDDPKALAVEIRPEPLGLDLAVDLVDLVDVERGGDLLDRVRALRRKIALELGLIIPPVRTRDNVELGAGEYVVTVHGVEMARGRAPASHVLVISDRLADLPGPETTEPVFGLPAKWLPVEQRVLAESTGATIVDRSSVITTHLAEVVRRHAAALLSRQEVKDLVDLVRHSDPAVVDELAASDLTIAEVQRVLQDLLGEQVPIRDLVRILDVLSERARLTRHPDQLTEAVRSALGPSISAANASVDGRLAVITLDPMTEHQLALALRDGPTGVDLALEPGVAQRLVVAVRRQVHAAEQTGSSPVLVTSAPLRRPLRRLLALTEIDAPVLALDELGAQLRIETLGMVNLDAEPPALLGS